MKKILAASIILLLAGCSPQTVAYRLVHYGDSDINDFKKFPSRKLTASNHPFQFIIDSAKVSQVNKSLPVNLDQTLQQKNTLAFLVLKNDTIAFEKYFGNYNPTTNIQAFSVTKSVTSLLTGCAIDDKLIAGENDLVIKYIPELKRRGFDNITILDILNMQAPINYTENSNPFGKHARLYYTTKVEKEMLHLTARKKGKRKFVYRSGEIELLGLILKRVLYPTTLTQYLQQKIWTPMGMESPAEWTIDNTDSSGIEKTFCCLATTARDLAKIGRLYLQNGNWQGKQIVSADWIKKSLAPLTDKTHQMVYNYNWWLYPPQNAFVAIGKDGQFIYVKPDKNLIIVRMGQNMGKTSRKKWFELFEQIGNIL